MVLTQWLLILVVVAGYWFGKNRITAIISQIGRERGVPRTRIKYVNQVILLLWTFLGLGLLCLVSEIGVKDFGIFFSSAFAILGVGLFAQWSILSNITASILVFFFFPYRVGHRVKILDGENSIEGILDEITLFHVILVDEQGNRLTYPNSMAFQKAVIISASSDHKLISQIEDPHD